MARKNAYRNQKDLQKRQTKLTLMMTRMIRKLGVTSMLVIMGHSSISRITFAKFSLNS